MLSISVSCVGTVNTMQHAYVLNGSCFLLVTILLLQFNWMALNARDPKKPIDSKKNPELLKQALDNRKQIMIFFPSLRFLRNSFVNPEI